MLMQDPYYRMHEQRNKKLHGSAREKKHKEKKQERNELREGECYKNDQCQEDGVCVDHHCECQPGFTGNYCETEESQMALGFSDGAPVTDISSLAHREPPSQNAPTDDQNMIERLKEKLARLRGAGRL